MKSDVPDGARAVRTEWAEWDLAKEEWGAPSRVTMTGYRPDGKIGFSEHRNPAGPVVRDTNCYNDTGLLTESRCHNGDTAAGRIVLFYDHRGRLIRQVHHGPDGSEHVTEECVYAADGSHTRVMYLPHMEGNVESCWSVEDIDYLLSAPGATSMTTAFDSHGLATELLLKDADGAVLRRLVLTRDGSGRVVKDQLFIGAEALAPDLPMFAAGATMMTSEYTYDELGQRVEVVHRRFGMSEDRETYRYDDRGNLTETTTEWQLRAANMHEGNLEYGEATVIRRQTRFAYKFDARGNWTERVVSGRLCDNPDFTPSSVERREIAYHGEPE